MSHLSTLIHRVKGREEIKDYGSLYEQAVINLMEYADDGDDITPEELAEAKELYDTHRPRLTGTKTKSHKERIKDADRVRKEFEEVKSLEEIRKRTKKNGKI